MAADIPTGDTARSGTDAELLTAARPGDAAALEALLVRYQPQLYRFGATRKMPASTAASIRAAIQTFLKQH
jgi:hypothetical protein